ncbi:MAG: hypothetical protein K940chlam8_01021 [Chlamydiae bacterium]|nr:hypothetical protein [Chlamydiota bacterium]
MSDKHNSKELCEEEYELDRFLQPFYDLELVCNVSLIFKKR